MAPDPTSDRLEASTSSAQNERPFRFLDLPAELRLEVYGYLVLVGKVFYTPDYYATRNEKRFKDWQLYRTPSLGILCVCKQIYNEAEELYLSRNLFVLPDFFKQPFSKRKMPNRYDPNASLDRPLFSSKWSNHVKNVSVAFNPRQLTLMTMNRQSWAGIEGAGSLTTYDMMHDLERREFAHAMATEQVRVLQRILARDLLSALPYELDYIEIDLSNSYCVVGCCRIFVGGVATLAKVSSKCTVVLGVRNDDEREDIMGGVGASNRDILNDEPSMTQSQLKEAYDIAFEPLEDVWEKWKMEDVDRSNELQNM
jgi:hypothetical protein